MKGLGSLQITVIVQITEIFILDHKSVIPLQATGLRMITHPPPPRGECSVNEFKSNFRQTAPSPLLLISFLLHGSFETWQHRLTAALVTGFIHIQIHCASAEIRFAAGRSNIYALFWKERCDGPDLVYKMAAFPGGTIQPLTLVTVVIYIGICKQTTKYYKIVNGAFYLCRSVYKTKPIFTQIFTS